MRLNVAFSQKNCSDFVTNWRIFSSLSYGLLEGLDSDHWSSNFKKLGRQCI